jgi:hypothetical protein
MEEKQAETLIHKLKCADAAVTDAQSKWKDVNEEYRRAMRVREDIHSEIKRALVGG